MIRLTREHVEDMLLRVHLTEGANLPTGPNSSHYWTGRRIAREGLATLLCEITGEDVIRYENFDDLNSHECFQVCLTKHVRSRRSELGAKAIRTRGDVLYLEISCCALAPIAEARWFECSLGADGVETRWWDLLDPEWLESRSAQRSIADRLAAACAGLGWLLVDSSITEVPADGDLPAPYAIEQLNIPEARVRDHLFQGVCTTDPVRKG